MTIKLPSRIGKSMIVDDKRIRQAADLAHKQGHDRVLAIVLATKPCFYKLWRVMVEAEKKQVPFFILNSGQHYDDVVGNGYNEFNFAEHLGVNYHLRGDLSQKTAEIYVKTKQFTSWCRERWPNIVIVPYVNGDTMTAAHLPGAWLFSTNRACIQGEAGLRSMSPKEFENLTPAISPEKLVEMQWVGEWVQNRTEPFPEQYDTIISAAACDYHFAPVKTNEANLRNEGRDPQHIRQYGR